MTHEKVELTHLIPPRIRVPAILPNLHVTGEQIDQFHKALAARGVREDQYRIEAVVIYDPAVEREVQEASYDIR